MSATNNGSIITMKDGQTLILPTASGQAFSIGDALYWDGSAIRPMSYYTGSGTAILDQEYMSRNFAGFAGQAHLAAETAVGHPSEPGSLGMLLWTNRILKLAVDANTFEPGDFIGVKSAAGGVAGDISDQTFVKVAQPYLAIGQVSERFSSSTTYVYARIWGRNFTNNTNSVGRGLMGRQLPDSETLPDANTTLTLANKLIQVCVPTAARTMVLPAATSCRGMSFMFINNSGGANSLTINNASAVTIATVAQNKRAWVFCDGTTWYNLTGA